MNQKIKYAIPVTAVAACLVIGTVCYNESLNKLVLKNNSVTLELGNVLSVNPKDYLADDVTDKVKKEVVNTSAILKDKNITYDKNKQQIKTKDKEFLDKGTYKLTFQYKKQIAEVNVTVKDTKLPTLTQTKKDVSVQEGTKSIDYKSLFKTEDIDNVDLTFENKDVKLDKPGTYKAKAIATDASGNKTEQEFNVVVTAKPKPKPKPKPTSKPSSKPSTKPSTPNKKPSNGSGSSVTKGWPKKYSDSGVSITITREWYQNAYVYAAHVQMKDYKRFGTAVSNNKYGGKETTRHAANRLGAILAINGCYSAPYLKYPVVRSGKLYHDTNSTWLPAVYSNKNGLLLSAWETGGTPGIVGLPLRDLVRDGKVTDTFSFGPPFLQKGVISKNKDKSRAQRTFIGTNGNAGDIWMVVSDGRYNDGKSAGLTYTQCAQFLKNKGCVFGVPLDGGGSSTMVFKGQVLNAERGHERAVVDHVYVK